MDVGRHACSSNACARHVRGRPPDTDRKRLEVLHDGGEVELVASAREASQPHSLETMMGLEVSKPHLDLLSLVARSVEPRGADQCAGKIAGVLVDVSTDLAKRHLRTALRFEWACIAIALGRKVAQCVVIADIARRREQLAGRADIDVALSVEREVAASSGLRPWRG
jgi:hypothetical protein